ncbi:MAG TPA: dTDP-4-dehydrorhamnose reductase [Thermoanaerobaculia bacterium]|nr:dTDP-4-dehydrorhamnose reductase [Thermoanaerobaculia bacterium]
MRTLIFGGTGMLGRAMVAVARRHGAAALALSRGQADLTDRERVFYWADTFRPELVVNCAAFTHVDDCEAEEERATAVNGEAVASLVEAARGVDARLVQVSTDYVFDGRSTEPYAEDAATAPLSAYGRSKLLGERHALADERNLVVRTSWLFGPGGANFVTAIVGQIAKGRRRLEVVDDQTGCPTYTPYLARAIWQLAASGADGIFHYRNREPVTWCGFAREIAHLVDCGVEVEPVTTAEMPRPAARPERSVLDVTRFERTVGRRVEPWGLGLVEFFANLQRQGRRLCRS